jgi:hypothetical protein
MIIVIIESCCSVIDRKIIYPSILLDSILQKPDSIKSIIHNSIYYDEKIRKYYHIEDDDLESYIPFLKKLVKDGYDYVYYQDWYSIEDPENTMINFYKEIQVKSKENDLYVNFYFITLNHKWIFYDIDTLKLTKQQRSKYFRGNP